MKKAFRLLRDSVEIYLPVLSFLVMFLAFIMQIFYRYVMNTPSTWAFEVTRVAFVWTVLFAGIYTMRIREHLAFTLVYDRFPKRVQPYIRIASNGIVCVGFCFAFLPSLHYISFMNMMSTTIMNIPMSVVYGPFLVFLIMVIAYTAIDIAQDVRLLLGHAEPAEKAACNEEHTA